MVEVRLVPMNKKEFEAMKAVGVKRYADENVKVGYWKPGEALQRSETVHANLLPDGLRTEGHHFYKALDAGTDERVGQLWLRVEPGEDRKGFIYDVFIDEDKRGKGYGRAMMLAIETKAKRMKIDSLALHVFAYNDAARHLYETLGYEVKSLNMMKVL
ncbi:MAG TPA: GNAT family N-acetyltransferase [Methanomassiliicoccales archaeon]|nr:GNAT family N-acetyltransferase [Methanomassiliicoccales archaeon]